MFVGLTEYFRTIVLPQQPEEWRRRLPCVPVTTGELKQLVANAWEEDERRALRQLSELGPVSASVLTYLELTRAIVAEAYKTLRDEEDVQTNLVEILSATRFKTYRGRRVYHTKCARRTCFAVASFFAHAGMLLPPGFGAKGGGGGSLSGPAYATQALVSGTGRCRGQGGAWG